MRVPGPRARLRGRNCTSDAVCEGRCRRRSRRRGRGWRERRNTAARRRVHPWPGSAPRRTPPCPRARGWPYWRGAAVACPRLGASPRGTLADTSCTRDRGPPPRPPGQTCPLGKHAPTASPHPLRTASTPSRPARELGRPATAVPVPSRGSHPGTRCRPRSPRAPRAAQTLQTTQLRVFPVFFSKVRPIPHPRSPQRVRARCCVRLRRLGAARSLFGVGSSLLQHGRRAEVLAHAALERSGPSRLCRHCLPPRRGPARRQQACASSTHACCTGRHTGRHVGTPASVRNGNSLISGRFAQSGPAQLHVLPSFPRRRAAASGAG